MLRCQSHDFDLPRQRCKFLHASARLARFEHKNILFYFEKRSSQQQRWRCRCKFKSRRIEDFSSFDSRSNAEFLL
jgi:hypothetical protein